MLIYSPDENNLNNFIAKLKIGGRKSWAKATRLKPFLVHAWYLGFKTSIRNKKRHLQNFLVKAMYLQNLPTRYEVFNVSYGSTHGDWTFKAAQPLSKRKYSRMQNLPEKKSETLLQSTHKNYHFTFDMYD